MGDIYLPPAATAGCAYCLDPSSAGVREAFALAGTDRGTPAAVARDLDFLI